MASPTCPAYCRRPVSTAKHLTGKHFPYKNKKRGRCLVCGDRKTSTRKRKDTKTQNFCPKCDVFLCQGKCFEDYHSRTGLHLVQSALPSSDLWSYCWLLCLYKFASVCVYSYMSYPYKQLHTVEFCVCKSYVCLCYHSIPLQVTILYKLLMDNVVWSTADGSYVLLYAMCAHKKIIVLTLH